MAFLCGACGHRTTERNPGWCPCGLDNAWFEDLGDVGPRGNRAPDTGRLVRADALDASDLPKVKTGTIFDTPLGGGVPRGACILLWAKSGAGKTRLALKLCGQMAPAVFVSLEMPEQQTASYLEHLGVPRKTTWVTRDRDWRSVVLRARPRLVVIDSITVFGHGAAYEMQAAFEWAHSNRVTVVCICHATKDGKAKGSSELEHYSDAALVVRVRGKRVTMHAPTKNRFAPTGVAAPIGHGSIV